MLDSITRRAIALALEEDLGPGDVTSALVPDAPGAAFVLAKAELVFAGAEAFAEVYRQLDPRVSVRALVAEGAPLAAGARAIELDGPTRSLLQGERTALNLIQRLSGIATFTARAVAEVAGTGTAVVDTRKTTPGLRALEKAAVRAGGAKNHRFGLFDGVLIKNNHVDAAGGVDRAIAAARALAHHLLKIECEVRSLEELDLALASGVDAVLLDNMDDDTMREAVARVRRRAAGVVVEASGNMTLERLRGVASTGVDLVSMGALTHTVRAADLALRWTRR